MGRHCEFEGLNDRQIGLQIFNGVRDIKLKKKLWVDDLSLDNVIKKCHMYEQLLDTRKMLSSIVTEDKSVHQIYIYKQQYSTEIGVVDHNNNSREAVRTSNNHNPEEIGRRHNNAEDHHSGSPHSMVVEYHIMDCSKVSNSVCLVFAGRQKRVVSVHCQMALDSVLHLDKYVFIVVSPIIFSSVVDPRKM